MTEHLKMKLIDRNVSMREESKGEKFHEKICLFCFLQEMNNFTFLLPSSALTELLHQLLRLANQGNKDHFYVSSFQRLCDTY